MPTDTKHPARATRIRYVTDSDLRALHHRADVWRATDRSLSDAVTDMVEDMETTRERLLMVLTVEDKKYEARREAAMHAHDAFVSLTYDLCEDLLEDAEKKHEDECEANDRNDRRQTAVA